MSPSPLPFRNPQLPLEARVADLVGRLTEDEKIRMLHQYQPEVPRLGVGAYKHGTEAAHGIAWLGQATTFPQPLGLAAIWDPELLEKVGRAIGEEARGFYRRDPAKNGLTLWAPTVDLERDPRWGRTEEAYGEDPHLVAETAGALVRGIQGDHPTYLRAAATLKHFLGNNHEADRGTVSVTMDPRNLHEYYHRPFERIFRRSGAVSMMTAYNAVNGVPCNLNPDVKARAKDEWGCAFVVSDAGDVIGTNREHRWFETLPEALAANLKAGIDSITDDEGPCLQAVRDALASGLLTWDDVDRAVANALRVRLRLGEFDPPGLNPYETLGEDQIGSPAHQQLSLEAAQAAVTLLDNRDGLLPLSTAPDQTFAVVGPLADLPLRDWYSGNPLRTESVADALGAAWGDDRVAVADGNDRIRLKFPSGNPVWDNEFELTDWGWGSHTLRDPVTKLYLTTDDKTLTVTAPEAFGWFTKEVFLVDRSRPQTTVLATWNAGPVVVGPGETLTVGKETQDGRIGIDAGTQAGPALDRVREACTPLVLEVTDDGLARAVAAARGARTAVVVVGNHPLINSKETIDRVSTDLPEAQVRLVRAVAAVNPRTVVVVVSGYPLALDGIRDVAGAIVHTTHAGPELGRAVAAVLDGRHNPSGKLPMTWYTGGQELPTLEDYDIMRGGRTYRWFAGQPLYPFGHGLSFSRVTYLEILACGSPTAPQLSVRVAHAGGPAVREIVQLYLSVTETTAPRPRVQLVGFAPVDLAPGQTKTVEFDVDPRDLEFWDVARGRWSRESAVAIFSAGPSSGDLRVSTSLTIEGEPRIDRDLTVKTRFEDADDHEGLVLEYGAEGHQAVGARWLAFHRVGTVADQVEVRVASRHGGTVELRWDSRTGPLAARIVVAPTGGTWTTLGSPVLGRPLQGRLFVVATTAVGRNEGLAWLRFVP